MSSSFATPLRFAPLLSSLTLLLPPSPSLLLSWRRRNVIAVDRALPRNSYYPSKNNYQPSTPTRPSIRILATISSPPGYEESSRARTARFSGSSFLRPPLANKNRYDWPARVQSVDGRGIGRGIARSGKIDAWLEGSSRVSKLTNLECGEKQDVEKFLWERKVGKGESF